MPAFSLPNSLLMPAAVPAQSRHLRHPGYAGWLLWVVGTQALLANPLCLVAFPIMVRSSVRQAPACIV